MQCDKSFISLIAGLMLFLDVLSGSRPVNPTINIIHDVPRLTVSDVQKARARWNAAYISKISDDEDLIIDGGEIGSGIEMLNDAPSVTNIQVPATLADSFTEVSCCNLGKLAGSKGKTCDVTYYRGYTTGSKTWRKNKAHGINRKQVPVVSPLSFRDTIALKYHKCSLKRFGSFYKCCTVQQSLFQRRYRLQRHSRHGHLKNRRIRH